VLEAVQALRFLLMEVMGVMELMVVEEVAAEQLVLLEGREEKAVMV
jgi:hypothetical protein